MTRTISRGQTTSTQASLAEELADELGPMMASDRAAFAHRCHERQISMAHLILMTKIEAQGSMPMTRVAELIGTSLPTATGLVGRMEDRGLVRREHDDHDRRVVNVRLTPDGREELSGLHAARRRRIAAAVATLTHAESAQLLASIRKLRAALARVDEQEATS